MKDNLLEALPLFLGAVFGVWLYYSVLPLTPVLVGLAMLAILGKLLGWLGKALLPTQPGAAVRVWQAEVLVPIALIALGGYGTMWVVDNTSQWLASIPLIDLPDATTDAGKDRIKTISAAFSTAITTFLGALLLDDQKKAGGGLWPPAQVKKAMKSVFAPKVVEWKKRFARLPGESDDTFRARIASLADELSHFEFASRAVHSEEIASDLPKGWFLPGALARSKLIRQHLINPSR